jgi:hypothetical protein
VKKCTREGGGQRSRGGREEGRREIIKREGRYERRKARREGKEGKEGKEGRKEQGRGRWIFER